nr:cyclic nucleotide-binding/CBS domain-containing protein [Pasteurella sp.]
MEIELLEIKNFLSEIAPFDDLPEDALNELVHNIEIRYFRAETPILSSGGDIDSLYVIRSGVVEVYRRSGKLYNRMTEKQIFGQLGLFMNNKVRFPVVAIEDTLAYCIPAELFHRYCDEYEVFADFMEVEGTQRLNQAISEREGDLTQSKVKTLITRPAVIVDQDTSITDTAACMKEESVSAVLVANSTNDSDEEEDIEPFVGIITDRDLCTRVLAEKIDPATSISEVVSPSLYYLDSNAYVYEAMMTMLRYNINHLPIMEKGQAIGIISNTDLLRHESQSSLLIVNSIFKQNTVEELVVVAEQVKDCFVRMVQEEANSHMVGSAMAVIGRSFKQRLAELAEEKLGAAPIPYCLLALGSMARDEQLIVTDQDNALILDESYDPKLHNDYFEQFSQFICDGLAACGYTYCTGDIMATNPEWRKTLTEWKETFADWIDNPNPKALLNSSIFFDLDGVYGRTKWAEQLYSFVVQRARKNNVFLGALAHTAGLR